MRWSPVLALAVLFFGGCASANPYQGMTAEQMYEKARQQYANRKYDDAIKILDRLLTSFAAAAVIPDARLLQGDANYAKGNYLTAQSSYQRFLDRYPTAQKAPMASLGVCRCLVALSPVPERDQTYTHDALNHCSNVAVDYPGSPEAKTAAGLADKMRNKLAEAQYDRADYYFRRKLYDSAILYYQFVDSLYGDTEYGPKALLGIYKANMKIGYNDLADQAKKKLLAKYPDSPEAKSLAANGGS
jgi:outer membrane protein assembly factor BamD